MNRSLEIRTRLISKSTVSRLFGRRRYLLRYAWSAPGKAGREIVIAVSREAWDHAIASVTTTMEASLTMPRQALDDVDALSIVAALADSYGYTLTPKRAP